jgi:integrase
MANKPGHRRFGTIRKLPSGRYQVRYLGPDGRMNAAPRTFGTKDEAARWLTVAESQLIQQDWIDPKRAKIKLQDYAERWIAERPKLRPRTVHLYTWTLGKHVTPYLGNVEVGRITTPMVREWRAKLLASGVSQGGAAKAYRLLRAVLMTAFKEDEMIRVNPCRIPGADKEEAAERPTLTVLQVMALAQQMPERFHALVLLTTFGCLRWGEVTALQRRDVDTVAGTVRVRQAFSEQRGTGMVLGPPKSKAGLRTLALPSAILPAIRSHIDRFSDDDNPDALIFTTETGRPVWRGNFNKLVDWRKTVQGIGVAGLHFHDLRHTGNTLAAQTGTSLRDLMTRMGHDSPRAALIYQHASSGADQMIAAALSAVLDEHEAKVRAKDVKSSDDDDDGSCGMPAKQR